MALALLPLVLALIVLGAVRLPIGIVASALVFFCLVVDNPMERPGMGAFESPLYAPGTYLFVALDASLGLPGVKLFGIELLFALLGGLVLLRTRGLAADGIDRKPASVLLRASRWAVFALILLELYGLATGGILRFSMLQLRALLFAVGLPLVLAHCFDDGRFARTLTGAFLAAALVRASTGIYYWATLMRHGVVGDGDLGGGTYVMTHSDSVLAALAVLYCLIRLYAHPSLRGLALSGVVLPVVGLFMVVNNRRVAFVEVILGAAAVYLAADRALRRRMHITVLCALPLLFSYAAAGWTSTAMWAKPVQTLRSVIVQEDSSSATRGIENYNLIVTLKHKPLIGWGLGHEYVEHVQAHDISRFFEAYRFVPHNSVLWLWTVGALPGAFAVFALLATGVFLAARTFRCSACSDERCLALLAVGAVAIFGVQAYGDMGLQSWMAAICIGSLLGYIGQASVRVGAWPAPWNTSGP